MSDSNETRALEALDADVAVLRARLADLEKAQPRRRLGRWAALVGIVALAGGTAWSASGNCPNGMQYCFTADAPALASEVNYNFSQLRDLGSAWVSRPLNSIPTTQTRSVVTSVSVPAGSYVVSAKLYGVASATAGTHNMLCNLFSSAGTSNLDFTNSSAAPSSYSNLSLLGSTTLAAPGTLTLECQAGPDVTGAYTLYGVSLVATPVAELR